MRKIFLMAMCLVAALSASATDVFYINNFTINPGETKEIEINLDNDSVYTALQADIYLPEGLTIEQEDGDYLFELTDRKGRNHSISSTMLSSGAIRILIASQTLKTFSGNSGALVTFPIIADNTFSGTKTIEMKNIIATDNEQALHYFPNQTTTVTQEGYVPPTGEADCFYINDFSINPGETKEIEINLDNDSVYTALQADIYLPEGLTIEQEDGDYLFELTDRKGRNHTISSTMLSSGAIRILIASQTLKTFSGNSGALVTFPIIADNTFSGTKTIEMKNIIATDNEQTLHYFPNTTCTVTSNGGSTEPGTTLAEILENGVNGTEYTISNDLAIVDVAEYKDYAFVTDGQGNWMRVELVNAQLIDQYLSNQSIKGGTLKGILQDIDLNPYLVVSTEFEATATQVDFEIERLYLNDEFAPKINQVIDVVGWWNASEGALRTYQGANGGIQGQSLTIDTSWGAASNILQNGKRYQVRCAINIKEPWNSKAGIHTMDYEYYFQNYIGYALRMPDAPTAIGTIDMENDNALVNVYNAQGQLIRGNVKVSEATNNLPRGIYIVGDKVKIIRF